MDSAGTSKRGDSLSSSLEMLAIGAADDCIGEVGMAGPPDVLEYRRCTRPYFVTCRRAADEDVCLKQGKTRFTIIRKIVEFDQLGCRRRRPVLPRSLAKEHGEQLPGFPRRGLACLLQSRPGRRQAITRTQHHP
jgi:hypothetical protein